jgi:hypothetical protein
VPVEDEADNSWSRIESASNAIQTTPARAGESPAEDYQTATQGGSKMAPSIEQLGPSATVNCAVDTPPVFATFAARFSRIFRNLYELNHCSEAATSFPQSPAHPTFLFTQQIYG